MEYTYNDLVEIVTSTQSLFYSKSILRLRFGLFENLFIDFPDETQIDLVTISMSALQNILLFFDTSILRPVTAQDWLDLLVTLDYLDPVSDPKITMILDQASLSFADLYEEETGEDFIYYSGVMGIKDVTLADAITEYGKISST